MGSTSSITNNTANCFFLGENGTRTEVTGEMLREMKNFSPALLIFYCFINISLGFLACIGNAFVVLTVAIFSELHIVSNIGLASLATVNFFHGLILHFFLFAVGVNVLVDSCPIFRSTRFAVFYISYLFIYCSISTLCIVTAERYIAVVFPLRYHAILPKERFLKLVAAAWMISFLLSIPSAIDSFTFQAIGKVIWILTFSLSLAFLFYCNVKIFAISRRHKRQVQAQAEAVQQMAAAAASQQDRFRGAGTMFYIVLTLLACYVPAIATRFVQPFANEDTLRTLTHVKPWTSTVFVMYSGVSPFVYFFRRRTLRTYSKKLFWKAIRFISCNNFA